MYNLKKNQNYVVTESQVKAVNVLLKVVEEAINRKCFSEDEVENILKISKKLSKNYNILL